MQHPFSVLQSEYTALLAAMTLTREAALESAAKRLVGFIDAGHYKPGCEGNGEVLANLAATAGAV